MTEANVVEGPIEWVAKKVMAISIKAMKPGKAARFSKICVETISSSGKVGNV